MQKVNKLFRKENADTYMNNNRGASLVTVIVTIGFVGLLLSMVMMITLVNFKMKRVNANAKDTFYSAERVLDEINIGLQRYVSDSLTVAYEQVLEQYSDYSIDEKNTLLKTTYYEGMWSKLNPGTGTSNSVYQISVLEGFLKDSTLWRGDDTEGYGAIVRAYDPSTGALNSSGKMVTYENNGIVLENVRVYYKDPKGYVTVITTDIRIAFPQFNFASSTALTDIAEYCVIADAGITTTGFAGNMDFSGSMYGDFLNTEATSPASPMRLTHTGEGQVIIKHAMDLKNAAFSCEEEASFWAEDIVADSSKVTLAGESNVANDLNIKGNGSDITLKGIYNGYGNSITEPEKSSAILVNGKNTTLDMEDLEKITIAGHAYVGTNVRNIGDVNGTEAGVGGKVYTGESVAVKSNQILYLVPGECIGVDRETGESLYGKNPLTAEEYNEIVNNMEKYEEVSTRVVSRKLGDTLAKYIKMTNGAPDPEKVFIPTNIDNQTMVYYYMKFEDENAANAYLTRYYEGNKAEVDKYAQFYADMITFPDSVNYMTFRFAGNVMSGDETDGYKLQNAMMTDGHDKMNENQRVYEQQFTALCTKLITNYDDLVDLSQKSEADNQVVFENLIDVAKFEEFINNSPNITGNHTTLNGADGKVILSKTDFVLDSSCSDVHFIVANGDVTVELDTFEGLIFANGEVTLNSLNGQVKAASETVRNMLRYYETQGTENVMVASILQGGEEFAFTALGGGVESESTSLSDLIVYENWKKE